MFFPTQLFKDLPLPFLRWGLLFYIAAELLASLALSQIPSLAEQEQWVIINLRLFELLGFIFLIWKFDVFADLGLTIPNAQAMKILMQMAAFCVAIFLLIYALVPSLFAYVSLPVWLYGIQGLFLMTVLAPIVEEIIFRGLLYRMLRERWGIALSVVVSAVFFSMVHHGSLLSPQLLGGIIFALAYEWSRSLWVSIGLHMGANSAVYTLSVLGLAAIS
jgi:membrane protease YdiL (CAAX protease family)